MSLIKTIDFRIEDYIRKYNYQPLNIYLGHLEMNVLAEEKKPVEGCFFVSGLRVIEVDLPEHIGLGVGN